MARRFSSLNRRVPESGEGLSLRRLAPSDGSTWSAAVAFWSHRVRGRWCL